MGAFFCVVLLTASKLGAWGFTALAARLSVDPQAIGHFCEQHRIRTLALFGREVDLAGTRALRKSFRRHEIPSATDPLYAA